MRSAWKTRRAGLPAAKRAGVGMLRLITSTSSPVVVERRLRALALDAPGDVARVALLAVAAEDVGELVLRQRVDEVGGRDLSCDGSMRMSSGAS